MDHFITAGDIPAKNLLFLQVLLKETGRIFLNAPGVWWEAARIFTVQKGCFRASGSLCAHLPHLFTRKAALGLLPGQWTQVKEWGGCKKNLWDIPDSKKACFLEGDADILYERSSL